MCGYCPANALQTGFLPPECCADHIIKQKSCTESSAPCWIDVRHLTMVPPRLMPLVREACFVTSFGRFRHLIDFRNAHTVRAA
jgi:hypothetical protein